MSAHPMLQPTDWSVSPDDLKGAVSNDRRHLYRIIWDSAIACTLVPPVLRHRRFLLQGATQRLAIAVVSPEDTSLGYWQFRQDYPTFYFPANTQQPVGQSFSVVRVSVVRKPGFTLGNLISSMEDCYIGTPATLAKTLCKAFKPDVESSALVCVETTQNPAPGSARIEPRVTEAGRKALHMWRAADLIPDSSRIHSAIDDVAKGTLPHSQVLAELSASANIELLAGISAYIDQQCERWRGVGREEGLRALGRQSLNLPQLVGLPQWLDPERQLSQNHPLRAIRKQMEEELAERHTDWTLLDPKERSGHRLRWLRDHRHDNPSIPELDGDSARFNALVHWMVG